MCVERFVGPSFPCHSKTLANDSEMFKKVASFVSRVTQAGRYSFGRERENASPSKIDWAQLGFVACVLFLPFLCHFYSFF